MPTSFWTQVSQWLEMPSASHGAQKWSSLLEVLEVLEGTDEIWWICVQYVFNSVDLSWAAVCCHSPWPHSSRALMQAWERDPHGSVRSIGDLFYQIISMSVNVDVEMLINWHRGHMWPPKNLSDPQRWCFRLLTNCSWPPMHLWRCWCLTDHVPFEPMTLAKHFDSNKSRIQEICQLRCVLTLHNLHNLSQKEQTEWNPNKARWLFSAKSLSTISSSPDLQLWCLRHIPLCWPRKKIISVVLDESLCDKAVGQNAFGYRERQPLFEVKGAGTLNAHPMHKMLQVCWHRAQRKWSKRRGLHMFGNGVAMVAMVAMVALVWHQSAQVSHVTISQLLAISGGMIRRVSKILKTAGSCRCFDVVAFIDLYWSLLFFSPFQRIAKASCPFSDHSSFATSAYVCWVPLHFLILFLRFPAFLPIPNLTSPFLCAFPFCWFSTNGVTTSYVPRGVRGFNEIATQVHAWKSLFSSHMNDHMASQLHYVWNFWIIFTYFY